MPLPRNTSQLDPATGYQIPVNSGSWANLSTWSSWAGWKNQPGTSMTVVSNVVDRNTTGWFNIKTDTELVGNITYSVYTSNTGAFAGEETITNVAPNTSNISAFYGRYFAVVANVSSSAGQAQLRKMDITNSNNRFDLYFNDVDSGSLDGTSSRRILPLNRAVGAVLNMTVTSHDPTETQSEYVVDDYILDYNGTTSTTLTKTLLSGQYTTQFLVASRYSPNPDNLTVYITDDGVNWENFANLSPGGIDQQSVRWSYNGQYLASVGSTKLTIWERSQYTFTQLYSNSSITSGTVCGWSTTSNDWLMVGQNTSPWLVAYKAGSGTYAAQAYPSAGVDIGPIYCIAWDPSDTYCAVGHGNSPYISIYKRSGNTFTKLTTVPTILQYVFSAAWNPAGTILTLGLYRPVTPEGILVNWYRSGDTFTDLGNIPALTHFDAGGGNKVTGIDYNSSGNAMVVCWNGAASAETDSRHFGVYRVSGNSYTWANSSASTTNPAWDITWNNTDTAVAVAQGQNHPWLTSTYPITANINYGVEVFDFNYSSNVFTKITALDSFLAGNITQVGLITTASNGRVEVSSTSSFADQGNLRIDGETITYAAKNATMFLGLTRGATGPTLGSSSAAYHPAGRQVFDLSTITSQNYIDPESAGIATPYIASKDRVTPSVVFKNATGYVASVFDARVSVLPEQYMDNTNINFR